VHARPHRPRPPRSPPQDRIYATYFAGGEGLPADEEARAIWLRFLPAERILPFDKKANFWEMGDTGPCGPCSEIHFDRIGGRDASSKVNLDDDTVIEIWNIVFMQFNREPSGALRELPNKHIDTGMGFERLTSILQGAMSNYDTDIFAPFFAAIQAETGAEAYGGRMGSMDVDGRDMAYRVIADHIRTLTFAVTDGAVPSNENRGYVLRRILRRAVRYGQQFLKAKVGFFSNLVPVVVANFKGAFPELEAKAAFVQDIIRDEEESFSRTLGKGIKAFSRIGDALKAGGKSVVPGSDAFFLYDSMGFPLDLTQIMAAEAGLTVDAEGFYACMAAQKLRSQANARFGRDAGGLTLEAEQTAWLSRSGIAVTDDSSKFDWHVAPVATVKAIFTKGGFAAAGEAQTQAAGTLGLVLDASSFYAESGGQVADIGSVTITIAGAEEGTEGAELTVSDVQVFGGYVVHMATVVAGVGGESIKVGDTVRLNVDYERRGLVAPNHTMTHVLNYALREVLGEGVDQRGSIVDSNKLRFDVALNKAPTPEQVGRVEAIVSEAINKALPVYTGVVPLASALAINGLRAVFGETYPDPVRVVSVGADISSLLADPTSTAWRGISLELCGGTHIANTSRAGAFALVEEGSVAKGTRRIVALTRDAATTAHGRAAELESEFAIARALTGLVLETKLVQLKKALDEAVISTHIKSRLRDSHMELVKKRQVEEKAEAAKTTEEGKAAAMAAATAAVAAGRKWAVAEVPIHGDGRIATVVGKAVMDAFPAFAFLGVTTDGAEKVMVFGSTSKEAGAAGVTAKEWVAAALAPADGKSGGREDSAQGTSKDVSKVGEMLAAANVWIAGKW